MSALRLDAGRLASMIDALGQVGLRDDGLHRPAFGEQDLIARALVAEWMKGAGLAVRVDAAGNVIGRREGSDAARGALATGSHIDTVPGAGRYDGAYGVLAGIAVAAAIRDAGVTLRHPLEVIAFADEEGAFLPGGLSGSRAMAGLLARDFVQGVVSAEPAWGERVAAAGGDLGALGSARRDRGAIAAYVELHVEQGPVLERAGVQIGVVTGVTGRHVYHATLRGAANHAGTTPMDMRHDAVVAASELVLAVRALATGDAPLCRTATVGVVQVEPAAVNVVPGHATLDIEIRDVDMAALTAADRALREAAAAIAERHGVAIALEQRTTVVAAPADPALQDVIEQAARAAGHSTMRLPSGAGHDAQAVATLAPIGMIFVPSAGGVSHSGDEYTDPDDCTRGAEVLLAALLALDARA